MPKDKNQLQDAAWNLNEALRESSQAFANTAVAAQERNMRFVQGVVEDSVEVLKSHAEASRSLLQEVVGRPEKGQALMQTLADSAVAAQERNVKFAQGTLQNSNELLKSHFESSRALVETYMEQALRQQEALQTLARENMENFMRFFFAPFSYYQQALDTAQSIVTQGVETTQRISRQGMEAAQRVAEREKEVARAATK